MIPNPDPKLDFVLLKAEDRAHRIGQQNQLAVHYLHAPGTIDDIIWPLLGKKLDVIGRTLDGSVLGTAVGKIFLC